MMRDFWSETVRLDHAARAVDQALQQLERVRDHLRHVDRAAAVFDLADANCEAVGDLQLKIEVLKHAV